MFIEFIILYGLVLIYINNESAFQCDRLTFRKVRGCAQMTLEYLEPIYIF